MDGRIGVDGMEGQVKEQDGRRRKKNNKLQIGLKEGASGISGGSMSVRVCVCVQDIGGLL